MEYPTNGNSFTLEGILIEKEGYGEREWQNDKHGILLGNYKIRLTLKDIRFWNLCAQIYIPVNTKEKIAKNSLIPGSKISISCVEKRVSKRDNTYFSCTEDFIIETLERFDHWKEMEFDSVDFEISTEEMAEMERSVRECLLLEALNSKEDSDVFRIRCSITKIEQLEFLYRQPEIIIVASLNIICRCINCGRSQHIIQDCDGNIELTANAALQIDDGSAHCTALIGDIAIIGKALNRSNELIAYLFYSYDILV
jgi:hypothetical protein